MRAEMFAGGSLKILETGNLTNIECGPDISPAPQEQLISNFDDNLSSTLRACFTDTNIVGGGWNGDFSFTQDTISEIRIKVNYLDTQTKTFDVEVVLPSCEAPSIVPSTSPSP